MEPHLALPLLAGLSPAQFMRRHWQKKPLVVRAAVPELIGSKPLLSRAALFKLACTEGVESRLLVKSGASWVMKNGPFSTRGLPPVSKPGWTLLVQGVDGHNEAVHQLLKQFRFVPDARLDDVMISFASPGGGVGAHVDSYDVFLLQASGSRRWQIAKQKDLSLKPGLPLKILKNFKADEEFVLHAGDMLYLPPHYAHDGVAEAAQGPDGSALDCMTYSIGFKSPAEQELGCELLHRLAEFGEDAMHSDDSHSALNQNENQNQKTAQKQNQKQNQKQTPQHQRRQKRYSDPLQAATANPALLPQSLIDFARNAVNQALQDPLAIACAMGEIMTAPKPDVWFDAAPEQNPSKARLSRYNEVLLHARTRMMYDADHVFINGESYRAKGADARLMRRLADQRCLSSTELVKASNGAHELLADWRAEGWLMAESGTP